MCQKVQNIKIQLVLSFRYFTTTTAAGVLAVWPHIRHTGMIQSHMTLQSNYNLVHFTECHIYIIINETWNKEKPSI